MVRVGRLSNWRGRTRHTACRQRANRSASHGPEADGYTPVPSFVPLSLFWPPYFPALGSMKPPVLLGLQQWALQDLNLRPTDYESAALTN